MNSCFMQSFRQHLLGKRHSKTILENAGKELDLDEWKEFQVCYALLCHFSEHTNVFVSGF